MLKNKILLLGGTGAIGSYLTDILVDRGFDVHVTTRKPLKSDSRVAYIVGDAKADMQLFNKICSTHWNAIVDFFSYKTDELSGRLLKLLSSTEQYVFISSARVFADEEHPIKEYSPRLLDVSDDKDFLSTDEYSLTKARQENLFFKSKNKNWTIVRPYITYGDERLQLGVLEKEEWLYRAMKGRTIAFPSDIIDKTTSIANGYDVALGIACLLDNEASLQQVYNITTPEKLTWKQIVDIYKAAIKEVTGKDIKFAYLSLDKFLSCRSPQLKYQVVYDRLYDRDFDTAKESELLRPEDFINVREGLTRCIANFIQNGAKFKAINWKYEAIKDKLLGESTPVQEIKGLRNKIKYYKHRYF